MNYCVNCGKPGEELHHVVPLSLGGNDIDSNKVWLCNECHNLIHNRSLGAGKLAAQSLNYQKALREERVGRPRAQRTEQFITAYKDWKAGKITGLEAIKRSGVSSATFYKMGHEIEKEQINR